MQADAPSAAQPPAEDFEAPGRDLLAYDAVVEEALHGLASGRGSTRGPALPVARSAAAAARDAVRVLAIFAAASVSYIMSGLPQTTDGLLHVAIYVCISMTTPDPHN